MTHRAHNFSAGPATLPLPVLEKAQAELVDFGGSGMSIMEMSHRGKLYDQVHEAALADMRTLLSVPDTHEILFFQGGARGHFGILAWNLLLPGTTGAYVTTGTWSVSALAEANKVGDTVELYSAKADGFNHVPAPGTLEVPQDAAYLHYTSNNTVAGTQFHYIPQAGDVPLVCDMSSDILSKPLPIEKYGLIYAGAQKNIGPAGVTVLIVRKDLMERCPANVPDVFNYKKMAAKHSMLNTPPCFAIYMVGLVARYLIDQGGLYEAAALNAKKAELLYNAIDGSDGYYTGHARLESRSVMNVTWTIGDPEVEKRFIAEATEADMHFLKGHRSVGGLRASIYNACRLESVEALVGFMADFKKRNG
jgi:phosphoserine aminotransferase